MTTPNTKPGVTDERSKADADADERDHFNAWRLRFTKEHGRMPSDIDILREARCYGNSIEQATAIYLRAAPEGVSASQPAGLAFRCARA